MGHLKMLINLKIKMLHVDTYNTSMKNKYIFFQHKKIVRRTILFYIFANASHVWQKITELFKENPASTEIFPGMWKMECGYLKIDFSSKCGYWYSILYQNSVSGDFFVF